jgi:hypothetical protein
MKPKLYAVFDKDQCCGTCRWWRCLEYTPTGRPKRDTPGRCLYQIVLPKMPSCVGEFTNIWKRAVWTDDGTNCSCYERKERGERERTD